MDFHDASAVPGKASASSVVALTTRVSGDTINSGGGSVTELECVASGGRALASAVTALHSRVVTSDGLTVTQVNYDLPSGSCLQDHLGLLNTDTEMALAVNGIVAHSLD